MLLPFASIESKAAITRKILRFGSLALAKAEDFSDDCATFGRLRARETENLLISYSVALFPWVPVGLVLVFLIKGVPPRGGPIFTLYGIVGLAIGMSNFLRTPELSGRKQFWNLITTVTKTNLQSTPTELPNDGNKRTKSNTKANVARAGDNTSKGCF